MPKYAEQLSEILKKYPYVTWSFEPPDENPPKLNLDAIVGYHVEEPEPEPEIEYYTVNVPKPSIAIEIGEKVRLKLSQSSVSIFYFVDGHNILSGRKHYIVDFLGDSWQLEGYEPLFEIKKRFNLTALREPEPWKFYADVAYVFNEKGEPVAYITPDTISVRNKYERAKELVDLLYHYCSGGAYKVKVNHPKTKQTSLDTFFLGKYW